MKISPRIKVFGILNITKDSFSDGGKFLEPGLAFNHAQKLSEDGADVIDLGAASSNPDASAVPTDVEIERLRSVLPSLLEKGLSVSIDSFNPDVHRWILREGWKTEIVEPKKNERIAFLNDIQGFPDESLYADLASSECGLIVMHSIQRKGIAVRTDGNPTMIFDEIINYFSGRLKRLLSGGIKKERIVLDPGMGMFLGADERSSLIMLQRIPDLKKYFGMPVLVSVSRKSFLGRITGRPVEERGAATLAAEIYAALNGVDFIRTHDVRVLKDALCVMDALAVKL